MAGSLHLVLLRGVVPDWIVPAGSPTTGRASAAHLAELRDLASRLELDPLDKFLVDPRAEIAAALLAAGWEAPALPAAWSEGIPLDVPPIEDADYVAAQDAYDVIVAEAEMGLMYFPAADCLRTIEGLIVALECDPNRSSSFTEVLGELRTFRHELEHAVRIKMRVHFEVTE